MSLSEAAPLGRLAGLVALRDRLAQEIDGCESPRDVAALSRQFTDVLLQIDEVDPAKVADAPKTGKDMLEKKRAERLSRSG